jgi:hypothetical protein
VVFYDQSYEPVQEIFGFVFRKAVNVLDVMADSEDTLPPSNGISTNDGVNSFKNIANVLGGSTRSRKEREPVVISSLFEARLCVVGC